ncbi:MAG: serine hydrolase [Candidatus Thermoplasmatota archaeon]|nr:serine hydrolase [Candidatus Thermoplasmatota archaeon]
MTAEKGKTSTDPGMAKLRAEIIKVSKDVKGQMGLYMKHVESGRQISIDGDKIFPLGSVFKIPLMVEVFRQAEEGLISMDEKLRLEGRNYCIGSGVLQYLSPGLELTVKDLLTLMIIATDNTASEMLWKRIGIQRVNMLIRELGLAKTSIYLPWREGFLLTMGMGPFKGRSVQEAARIWKGLSDIERMKILNEIDREYANLSVEEFRRRYENLYGLKEEKKFKTQREYDQVFDNLGTPREMGLILEKVLNGEAVSSESGTQIIALMMRNVSDSSASHYLSDDVVVASKSGITAGTVNNAGIIYVSPKSRVVLCVFFKNLVEKSPEKAQLAEAKIARLVYDHFSKAPVF